LHGVALTGGHALSAKRAKLSAARDRRDMGEGDIAVFEQLGVSQISRGFSE
jgi:hypothetical protein